MLRLGHRGEVLISCLGLFFRLVGLARLCVAVVSGVVIERQSRDTDHDKDAGCKRPTSGPEERT